MRVISQDGTIDVPYEMVAIQMDGKTIDYLYTNLENDRLGGLTLGKYSTLKKAIKAMEMLREAWMNETVEFEDGIYHRNIIFQFPQDDEIEV